MRGQVEGLASARTLEAVPAPAASAGPVLDVEPVDISRLLSSEGDAGGGLYLRHGLPDEALLAPGEVRGHHVRHLAARPRAPGNGGSCDATSIQMCDY